MEPEIVDVETQRVARVRRVIGMDEMRDFYDSAFGAVVEAVAAAGGAPTGAAFGWYHGRPSDTVDVAAGFPVDGVEVGTLEGDVEVVDRAGGRAVVALHIGPYEQLGDTYGDVDRWMGGQGLQARDDFWEEYLTEPTPEADPATMQTRIVRPLA